MARATRNTAPTVETDVTEDPYASEPDVIEAEDVTEAENQPAENVTEAPAKQKRQPKPVTDIASASVAFRRAKRRAEKADKDLADAQQAQADAHQALTDAATALKGYSDEIAQAAQAELSGEAVTEG